MFESQKSKSQTFKIPKVKILNDVIPNVKILKIKISSLSDINALVYYMYICVKSQRLFLHDPH